MTVVSNTTPLNYLILIGRVDLLNKLYGLVIIPDAVFKELTAPSTPQLVRDWIANKPPWLTVKQAPPLNVAGTEEIQIGEREAIGLAKAIGSDHVLLDDRRARRVARDQGVNVVGTLGILVSASDNGLTHLTDAINDLKQTNFRASHRLLESLLNPES
jgi:predicted nucleic acid-binding protein